MRDPKQCLSITHRGITYAATVVLVRTKDAEGRPKQCEFTYDDEATLGPHLEFIVVYAPQDPSAG